MNDKLKVSILGASGFGGGELLRILLGHPNVEIKQVTSRKFNKLPVTVAHPNLRGFTDLKFSSIDNVDPCDLIFVCLPNGESQKYLPELIKIAPKIIDLGADYRLKDLETYEKWYGKHLDYQNITKFVYGVSEINRQKIQSANYIACGGCEATASLLTVYPLFRNNLVELDKTILDVKIGSSATGGQPSLSTHHPIRSGVIRSYKPTGHRHTAEIEQELSTHTESMVQVHLSATAIEAVRGILVTAHLFLTKNVTESELWKVYRDTYSEEPFVRLINEKIGMYRMPEPKLLSGTNFCDIALQKDPLSKRVVVIGAIDNLGKGTAGQAVHAMNVRHGWPETLGLEFTGLHPI